MYLINQANRPPSINPTGRKSRVWLDTNSRKVPRKSQAHTKVPARINRPLARTSEEPGTVFRKKKEAVMCRALRRKKVVRVTTTMANRFMDGLNMNQLLLIIKREEWRPTSEAKRNGLCRILETIVEGIGNIHAL